MADRCTSMDFISIFLTISLFISTSALDTYYLDSQCKNQILYTDKSKTQAGLVKVTEGSSYGTGMDCTMVIIAPVGHRIMAKFIEMDIHRGNTECEDYVEIHEDIPSRRALTAKLCGQEVPVQTVVSNQQQMAIHFHSDQNTQLTGFTLVFTIFHAGTCLNGEFQCNNGLCIDKSLQCNGYDNCGDYSDQCVYGGFSAAEIGGIIAAVVVVIIIIIAAVVFFTLRKRKRDHRFERETSTNFEPVSSGVERHSSVNDHDHDMAYLAPEPERYMGRS